MFPPFFIGYYQDKHYQSLEIDKSKEELIRNEAKDEEESKSLVPADAEPDSSGSSRPRSKNSSVSENQEVSFECSGMSPINAMSSGLVSGGNVTMDEGEELEMTLLKKSYKLGLVLDVIDDSPNGIEVLEFQREEIILLGGDIIPGDKIIKFNKIDVRQTSARNILDLLRESSALPPCASIPLTIIKRKVCKYLNRK